MSLCSSVKKNKIYKIKGDNLDEIVSFIFFIHNVLVAILRKETFHKHKREEAEEEGVSGGLLVPMGMRFGNHLVTHNVEHCAPSKSKHGGE